jgi:hypothetical protein
MLPPAPTSDAAVVISAAFERDSPLPEIEAATFALHRQARRAMAIGALALCGCIAVVLSLWFAL